MIENDAVWIAFWAVITILIYGLVARGLFRATESLRYSLLDLSAPLLENSKLADDEKEGIEAALSDVHSAWAAWRILFSLLIVIFLLPRHRMDEFEREEEAVPADLRACYDTFRTRWIVATLANSPMACLLFTLLIIGIFIFVSSLLPVAFLLLRQRTRHEFPHNAKHAA